jgi:hypothetical protein
LTWEGRQSDCKPSVTHCSMTTDWNTLLYWSIGGVAVIVALFGTAVALRGRRIAGEHVFRASRWSRGNHLFPTQVAITPTSVVHYTARWFGRREETIHMAHIASVKIETGMVFSDVLIETSGGSAPILCHGHGKGDAARMKELIEKYQTAYYRGRGGPGSPVPVESGRIDR